MRILLLSLSLLSGLQLTSQDFSEFSQQAGVTEGFGSFGPFDSGFGAGISFADFDGDGWDDLTVATKADEPIRFYRNTGGIFEPLLPLVPATCHSKQVLWVDIDNDGDKDFFHTCFDDQNRIYENTGDLKFADRTAASGLEAIADRSVPASFGDLNRDGFLDLFVGNYGEEDFLNHLYVSNGDFTFTRVTESSGMSHGSVPTLASAFVDINADLDPELYVSIDKDFENLLFRNNGDGTVTDISMSSNANVVLHAMTSSGGDYDGDGDLDLFISNIPVGSVLLRNNGDETFTDVTLEAGVGLYRTGWAGTFVDCENDGDLDLYVCVSTGKEPNALFINDGSGKFTEPLLAQKGFEGRDTGSSFSNVYGDFNHDGLPDFAVSNTTHEQVRLWKNNNYNANNWIKVDLQGQVSNRDGVGAWIKAYAGGKSYVRYTHAGDGYLGQNSDFTHFGLGIASTLDSLVVLWPSGVVDRYYSLPANQALRVVEGSSQIDPVPCAIVRLISSGELMDGIYNAELGIESKGIIESDADVALHVGEYLHLGPGFLVHHGGLLMVDTNGCP